MHASRTDSSLNRWDDEGGAPKVRRSLRTKCSTPAPQATSALYYFNIRSDRTLIEDPDGLTLPDLKAALQEALDLARLSVTDGIRRGDDRRGCRVEIMDLANEDVMTVFFT